jgi:DNA-directed RNA polymerase subunit alpha
MIDSTHFEGKLNLDLRTRIRLTIGNALRRVLLSALEGYAIIRSYWSVDHEFSTISGVVEDVTEIISNLARCFFKRQIEWRYDDNEKLIICFW